MTGPEGLCSGSRTEVISQELEGATSDLSPVYCDLQGQDRQPGEKAHAALPPPSGQCTDRPIIKLAYQKKKKKKETANVVTKKKKTPR